ncbi:2-hydroxyacyl-CoA lyase 2 [Aphelenchoides besseyi]|nr:2-hydroxyacyl-CoA lyase 2 [Aphelenchoides besseyi]
MHALKRFLGRSSHNKHWVSDFFRVDEQSKRHGGELVAEALKAHGVQEVFTLCGGHISPIIVACESLGIRIVDTRHEVTTVYAADAVARLRQSIGVAAVTSGPGVTNTITAVKNAQMAESPLLLIGGAAPTLMKDRGALQDIDQLSIFKSICKHTARITRLRDIGPVVQKSIQIAQSGTPGPVFIEFPIDVLYPYKNAFRDCIVPNANTLRQKWHNFYCLTHISWQFGRAFEPQSVRPLPVDVPRASLKDVTTVAELVAEAERPLLLLGSQATLPPIKAKELQQTVNELGLPCYLSGMCRGLLGQKSELQMRQNRRTALEEADLVILAGTAADFRLDYGKLLSTKSKVVVINRDEKLLKKRRPQKYPHVFWHGDHLLQADVASTLVAVRNELEDRYKWTGTSAEWIRRLRERNEATERKNQKKMEEKPADGGINPLNLLGKLDKVIPEDAILVADGGDFVGSAAYILRPRGPLQWLDPGAFGTLGVGGGFALGAKTVYPNRPVVIVYGDGSAGYSIVEFDTFVRNKLPVAALIGNDACWTQIAREQVPFFKTAVACDLDFTHYEKTVESLAAKGVLLDEKNEEKTEEILKSAIEGTRNGDSTLVNALVGKTNFREGSISV